MAKFFFNKYGKYDCTLEVSPNEKCKLTIRKSFCSKYELSFDNIGEYMEFVDELQSLYEKWIEKEEFDAGYRKFYME